MERAGFALLVILAVALVRISDSQRGATGGRREEGAGAGRPLRDQHQSRDSDQGHNPVSSHQTSGHSGSRSRRARGASSPAGDRHPSVAAPVDAAGGYREDSYTTPREVALRTARHPSSQQQQQHRAKVNRRQSSRQSSASTRRLAG